MEKIKFNHFALFLTNGIDKNQLISDIIKGVFLPEISFIKLKKVIVFSEITLKEFIEFENRFGFSALVNSSNQEIATHSGGEQKKALLNYCISQQPDYLILDNPFDNLDILSQKELSSFLTEISNDIVLIQLVNRKSDLLPFIEQTYLINNKGKIENNINIEIDSIGNQGVNEFNKIPEPIVIYNNRIFELVKFENVSVNYNSKPILSNINWQINKNEFWQLIGPNGAGKSTLLSMIIGDNPKAYGQNITIFNVKKGTGESVWDLKKYIGYFTPAITNLFARNTTLLHMIVSGMVDSIGLYQQPTERQLRIAKEWLNVLEMAPLKAKAFYKLTAGQQRLAMIARAMVKHPPLLILDEPTAGLDDHNALLVTQLINKIAVESETSIIYVSHRTEPGLMPDFIFELKPQPTGSIGRKLAGNLQF